MILLWISLPDLHFIHRTHPPNFCSDPLTLLKVIVSTAKVHVQIDRQTDMQTDWIFLLVSCSKTYKTWTFIKRKEFFFYSCDYNTFSLYILHMWWESKKDWEVDSVFQRLRVEERDILFDRLEPYYAKGIFSHIYSLSFTVITEGIFVTVLLKFSRVVEPRNAMKVIKRRYRRRRSIRSVLKKSQ